MDAKFFRQDADEDQFDIHIDRNGQWFHQGQLMTRTALAKLFSTVLHYDTDKDEYWLVTPHEQGRITVDDVPYIITDCDINADNNTVTLRTNFDEVITIGPDHPIIYNHEKSLPYVVVRNNVRARLNRPVRERLIHYAMLNGGMDDAKGILYLYAGGEQYVIATMNEGDVGS